MDQPSTSPFLAKNAHQSLWLGVVCVLLGQHILSRDPVPTVPTSALGIWLDSTMKLRLPDTDAALVGLLFLLVGGLLLILSFATWPSQPSEDGTPTQSADARPMPPEWIPMLLVGSIAFIVLIVQSRNGEYHDYSPRLWLLAPACFAFIAWTWDRQRGVRLSAGITRQDALWMLGLLIVGLLYVTYRLQGWPDQLMGDEGLNGSVARDIANRVFLPPLFAQGVDTFPILATYWQGLVMRYFGVDIWGWRMASVLPGLFTIPPLYLLARDAFSRRTTILASLALLGLPYFLVFSRLGYMISQPLFILTLSLYLLQSGLRKKSALYLLLAGTLAGLGFYSYFSSRIAILIALVYVSLLWLTRQLDLKWALRTVGLLLFGALLVAAPYVAYASLAAAESMPYRFLLSFFNTAVYGGAFYPTEELTHYAPLQGMGDVELFYNPRIFLVLILRGYTVTLLNFHMPGLMWEDHYMNIPLAGTVGVVFVFLGTLVALRNLRQPRFQLILLWGWAVLTGLSALNTFPPRDSHLTALIPALALLAAFGLEVAASILTTLVSGLEKHTRLLLALLTVLLMAGGAYDYFVKAPRDFPQQAENVMSWAALARTDETFLYVYLAPEYENFKPWVVKELRQDVPFRAIHLDEFERDPTLLTASKMVVFYSPELDARVTSVLRAAWGDQLRSRTFFDSKGILLLMADMNTDFIFERERPFPSTLLDAFQHPAFLNLLAGLMILFLLVAYPSWRRWPQMISTIRRRPPGQAPGI